MCISHKPELLKKWKPKKLFIAYKTVDKNNRSTIFDQKQWFLGVHSSVVSRLSLNGYAVRGFYVYIDREMAFRNKELYGHCKVIAVHIDPKDVVYAGYCDPAAVGWRIFVCRRLTVKSLRGLREGVVA